MQRAVPAMQKILHSAANRNRYLLVLKAYMDESGHSKDPNSRFVGMGGLIAECDDWIRFEADWKAALDDVRLEAFHMKDFAHSEGDYFGWVENKRRKHFGALVKAIVSMKVVPVGCVVSLDAYNRAPAFIKEFYLDPYFMAFQQVTKGAALQAVFTENPFVPHEPSEIETVAMVYAYQAEFGATESGRAQQLWHAMKNLTNPIGRWMGSYKSEFAKNLYPLQAADLLAYELTKEFENQLSRPDDRMRWALRRILPLGGDQPLLQFYDDLEMIRVFLEATGQEHKAPELITHSFMRKIALRTKINARATEDPDD
jgi:hypothetical protein